MFRPSSQIIKSFSEESLTNGVILERKNISLQTLYNDLLDKKNSTFSELAYLYLSELTPLNTNEMHLASKSLICSANNEVIMQFYKFHSDSDAGKIMIESLRNYVSYSRNCRH